MQMREIDYVETKALTQSFKWEREDSFIQHDVQEFSKVLFEALEVSFADTNSYDTIEQLFQGESLNYILCKNKGCDSSNLEKWLDLQLIIENPFEKVPGLLL
jgi:ASC-1-like (ASCH) protein